MEGHTEGLIMINIAALRCQVSLW